VAHNVIATFLPMIIGVLIGTCIVLGIRKLLRMRKRSQLIEIEDSPFPYDVLSGGGNYYIVFDLGDEIKLWCDYDFGIREDGIYGIEEVELEGFNSYYNSDVELKIGQSVFPLVENMQKLTDWLDKQPFNYKWDKTLHEKWEEMKKKLNNLRYLESKSKEKEKKQK
jgi:hypothetical protein